MSTDYSCLGAAQLLGKEVCRMVRGSGPTRAIGGGGRAAGVVTRAELPGYWVTSKGSRAAGGSLVCRPLTLRFLGGLGLRLGLLLEMFLGPRGRLELQLSVSLPGRRFQALFPLVDLLLLPGLFLHHGPLFRLVGQV